MWWHKSVVTVDASVDKWMRNIQYFCVYANNCIVRCDFIVFLMLILSANHTLNLWHLMRRCFCSLNEKLLSQADYFSFNQRLVAAC